MRPLPTTKQWGLFVLVWSALASGGCRTTYVAPPARELVPVRPTGWTQEDHGDAPTIDRAEAQCRSQLSPRAVASAFRAVDEVADALLDLCTIGIVDDDPLVWHLWCGSDALFGSGHYLPADGGGVACEGRRATSAFECMGRIVSRHLLSSEMRAHVQGVEIVSIGSVDRQPINMVGQFVGDPCVELQGELGLSTSRRWSAAETPDSAGEGSAPPRSSWNRRLSWCRAAYSAVQLRLGFSAEASGQVRLGAIGAGTDWLDHWREGHEGNRCPTSVEVSQERQPGQCRDARRVDIFLRVRATEGHVREEECSTPNRLRGGESGRALYCYSDCSARAAVGRNPQGYRAPSSPPNLLFGRSSDRAENADIEWIVQARGRQELNLPSIRTLLLRE